jgi:peroxiredoxin
MARSLLMTHATAPSFSLADRNGDVFDIADIKKKDNLVLFFLTQPDKTFLSSLDEVCGRLRQKNAVPVVVVACPGEAVKDVCQEHRLLFALLADEDRRVTQRYLEIAPREEAAALFVADRAGTLFFQCVVDSVAELPSWDDVSASLDFIESQQTPSDRSL